MFITLKNAFQCYIQGVNEGAHKLWTQVPQTKTQKNFHIKACPETFNL
jgi:hypothetical protein